MVDTITIGASTFTPTIVDGYASSREARTIVHPVLGVAAPDVTIRPALLRNGTMRYLFRVEADAVACENAHATATGSASFTSDDRPTLNMTYVVAGGPVGRTLHDETRDMWILEIPFQEISP
jgi:hypothetical protein